MYCVQRSSRGCQDNRIASLGSVHLHYLHCVLHSLRFHGSHMISISLLLHAVLHALRGHGFQPVGVHSEKSSPYCNKVAVKTARNAKIRVLNAADIYSKNGERTKGYPLTTIYIWWHLCHWWPSGVPGKQAPRGEIVTPVLACHCRGRDSLAPLARYS